MKILKLGSFLFCSSFAGLREPYWYCTDTLGVRHIRLLSLEILDRPISPESIVLTFTLGPIMLYLGYTRGARRK